MTSFAAIFWAKRRMAIHNLASIRHESRLKVAVVGGAAILLWAGLLFTFLRAFSWLQDQPGAGKDAIGVGDILMARLLGVFAVALLFMLLFSNVLIAFSTMYKAKEVHYLLVSPISIREFYFSRLVECVAFSSWASAYMGSPLIIAYGAVSGAPLAYYAAAACVYLPFVTIPAALGSMIAMTLTRIFPHLPRRALVAASAIAVAAMFLYLRQSFNADRLANDSSLVGLLMETTALSPSPFLPSTWASQGILSAAHGAYSEAAFLLLLLLSNALFFAMLGGELARRVFLAGFSAVAGSGENSARPLGRGLLGRLDGALAFLPDPIRPLIVKDIKLFWRDPAQWTQFVIFFGIMAVYVANLDDNSSMIRNDSYRSFIAGLNIAACSLILASLTSRFVYPLISLEGFRFWILGLAPLTLRQLMWQKFWLSVAMTAPFTVALIVLSSWLLDVGPMRFTVAVYSMALSNLSLAGLAVGLGSLYPNFEEDNPARIVSGMGGTLNFLLSVGYIAVIVASEMFLFQFDAMKLFRDGQQLWTALAVVIVADTLLSLACMLVPMALGHRNLSRTEF